MKIIVAIAHHGTKNLQHLQRLISAYRSMPFEVDIVVLTERAKGLSPDVTEKVGLPTPDPWSLPFAHRSLFIENVENYDLFIYSEDDTLILESHVRAFLQAVQCLPRDRLPGFVRYERHPDGRKNYPDIHGAFHWIPKSVARFGPYVGAELSNEHSACYMLTRAQLVAAIASGGYASTPHSGRYDLLCTAATDPYTQCGFRRTICISHLSDFELHHLPNAYLDRTGIGVDAHQRQVAALFEVLDKTRSPLELLAPKPTPDWEKDYHEPVSESILLALPRKARSILSIGCGAGETEVHLVRSGRRVTAVPLDAVIGSLPEAQGVRLLVPSIDEAFDALGHERFDAVLLADLLQHLPDPVGLLRRIVDHLEPGGVVVARVPNLAPLRRLLGRMVGKSRKWSSVHGTFDVTALHFTSERLVQRWLRASGLCLMSPVTYDDDTPERTSSMVERRLPNALAASHFVLAAHPNGWRLGLFG